MNFLKLENLIMDARFTQKLRSIYKFGLNNYGIWRDNIFSMTKTSFFVGYWYKQLTRKQDSMD